MKAMLLAAGLGTRLKPFTDHHPKALAQVHGKSLLQWNIEYLQKFGIRDIVINVHHFAQQIIDVLEQHNGWGSNFEISDESEAVLETGGGLLYAKPFLEGTSDFLLMNVDMLTNTHLGNLLAAHKASLCLATLAVQQRTSSRQLLFNKEKMLCGWQHTETGQLRPEGLFIDGLSALAFSGIQVLKSDIFSHIRFSGKFSLIDLYLDICERHSIAAWEHTGDLLIDVGKPESLARAATLFAN